MDDASAESPESQRWQTLHENSNEFWSNPVVHFWKIEFIR